MESSTEEATACTIHVQTLAVILGLRRQMDSTTTGTLLAIPSLAKTDTMPFHLKDYGAK